MYLIIVLFCALVVNCDGRALESDEIFGIMLVLFKRDRSSVVEEHKVVNEDDPQFSDGVWKCGNCSGIDDTKFIGADTFDLDTNEWSKSHEVQISFTNIRCAVLEPGAVRLRRVSGACAGDYVALSVPPKSPNIHIKFYE